MSDRQAHRPDIANVNSQRARLALGCLIFLALTGLSGAKAIGHEVTLYRKQVFPPRSESSSPAFFSKIVPFVTLLGGDLTKSFFHITSIPKMDMSGFVASSFRLGPYLSGSMNVPPHISDAGGAKVFFVVNATSDPPRVRSEGAEVHFQFIFPTLLIKGYYKDFSTEGDLAMGDAVSEKVQVDVFITPATTHLGFPTYYSARAVFSKGVFKKPEKCTYWVGVIFPVNMCDLVEEYLEQMKPAIEQGLRDALQQTNTRKIFDEGAAQYLLAELRGPAGLDPTNSAKMRILQGSFQGTNYIVNYTVAP